MILILYPRYSHIIRGIDVDCAVCCHLLLHKKVTWIYRLLMDECFEEFRHHMYRVRSLKDICSVIADDMSCPACPKVSSTVLDLNYRPHYTKKTFKFSSRLEAPKCPLATFSLNSSPWPSRTSMLIFSSIILKMLAVATHKTVTQKKTFRHLDSARPRRNFPHKQLFQPECENT